MVFCHAYKHHALDYYTQWIPIKSSVKLHIVTGKAFVKKINSYVGEKAFNFEIRSLHQAEKAPFLLEQALQKN